MMTQDQILDLIRAIIREEIRKELTIWDKVWLERQVQMERARKGLPRTESQMFREDYK